MFVINSKNLGLAGGLLFGIFMLLLTWLNLLSGYGSIFLSVMTDIYPGYSISFFGAFVGMIYGFVDAFICLYLLGWLYNFLEH